MKIEMRIIASCISSLCRRIMANINASDAPCDAVNSPIEAMNIARVSINEIYNGGIIIKSHREYNWR